MTTDEMIQELEAWAASLREAAERDRVFAECFSRSAAVAEAKVARIDAMTKYLRQVVPPKVEANHG